MANHHTFPPGENKEAWAAYQRYLEPNQTLETIGAAMGISHNTLRAAFNARGYPLKVNRRANAREVVAFQREANVPIDYLAARFRVHENTVRKWLRRARARAELGQKAAHMFWQTLADHCETPDAFYHTLANAPHNLKPQAIPVLYHRRIKPKACIVWQLETKEAAREVDTATLQEMAEMTEADTSAYPRMFLGQGQTATPVRWADESTSDLFRTPEPSDFDAQSILDDL